MKPYDEYLLVDGYNIIFDWEHLKKLAAENLDHARARLIQQLGNYQGYRRVGLIIVFDAHKVKGGAESVERYGALDVVYTAEAETADAYIERVAPVIAKRCRVTVATSDWAEQVIIMGAGAYRLSARELLLNVRESEKHMKERVRRNRPVKNNQFLDNLDPETAELMEKMRLDQTIERK